ncbi:MAG: hypothetical protein M3Q73_00815 [bacterium]|nr:hypothetical protein [bacterium]
MATKVTGELRSSITDQLFEIGRQIRQPNGYPFDPKMLRDALQSIIEGNLDCEPLHHYQYLMHIKDSSWKQAYTLLGMDTEFEAFISENPKFNERSYMDQVWMIPIIKGLTIQKIVQALGKLNVTVTGNYQERSVFQLRGDSSDTYVISFKRALHGQSVSPWASRAEYKKEAAWGISPRERLMLELGYFLATGLHLDIYKSTVCPAMESDNHRSIPSVGWNIAPYTGCSLQIGWVSNPYYSSLSPHDRPENYRVRVAITHNGEPCKVNQD